MVLTSRSPSWNWQRRVSGASREKAVIELHVLTFGGVPGESSPVYFSPLHISAVWPCEDHGGSAVWIAGKGVTQVTESPDDVAGLVRRMLVWIHNAPLPG